ncbi:hypothetical protein LX36DRAFT_17401 [Colletotrichum falcatum]|nr:hypothetical protein LX36DRAFT_17401 [Colletotrichum falcatum]
MGTIRPCGTVIGSLNPGQCLLARSRVPSPPTHAFFPSSFLLRAPPLAVCVGSHFAQLLFPSWGFFFLFLFLSLSLSLPRPFPLQFLLRYSSFPFPPYAPFYAVFHQSSIPLLVPVPCKNKESCPNRNTPVMTRPHTTTGHIRI